MGERDWSHCCAAILTCTATPPHTVRATLVCAGSGWEQFLQFGNTLLQDKIMVGLSWEAFGLPMEALVEEYAALPLKDSVIDKWLYRNAQQFFRLG